MDAPVLVMGATGSFGLAMVHELVRRGRPVRAQGRTCARLEGALGGFEGVERASGDALHDDPVMSAANGCGVIVHAVNLLYSRWVPDMEYITATVLRAARANRSLVVFPATSTASTIRPAGRWPRTRRCAPIRARAPFASTSSS